VTNPMKHYQKTDKYMRGVEKVTSEERFLAINFFSNRLRSILSSMVWDAVSLSRNANNLISHDCSYHLRQFHTVARSPTASATPALIRVFFPTKLDCFCLLYASSR